MSAPRSTQQPNRKRQAASAAGRSSAKRTAAQNRTRSSAQKRASQSAPNGTARTQQARVKNAASQNRHAVPAKKRRRRRNHPPGLWAWVVSLIALLAGCYLIYEIIRIDVLPFFFLILVILLILALSLGPVLIWLLKTRKPVWRLIAGIAVVAIGIVFGVGGSYVHDTEVMFDEITTLTDKKVNTMTTLAMKVTGLTEPKNMTAGARVGIVPSLDSKGTQEAVQQLRDKGAVFDTVEYNDPFALVDALYALDVDAIIFPENYHYQIYDVANDENQYNALYQYTNQLDEYIFYTDRDPSTINKADPVGNIMTDPFAVLVSGNDSYGTIDSVSRSDVNMVVVVNPKTAQILMISIPRDSYVEISCRKSKSACEDVEGEKDKLTHTGILGVGTTESTIEDLLDMKINYYVRVNFSSLVNLVDAVGGIDVNVPEGQEVDKFYANGEDGVHAGMNHLEGDRALAFARERHAYADGDNQRVQNQQTVMRALIQKCLSPAMFVNYPNVVKAVSTAIDTNMTAQELKSLVTLEIARRPHWTIQSYAITGEPSTEYSALLQTQASVTVPVPSTVAYAKQLIKDAEAGKQITVDPDASSQYSDLDVSAQKAKDSESRSSQGEVQYDPYTGLPVEPNSSTDSYGGDTFGGGDPYGGYYGY